MSEINYGLRNVISCHIYKVLKKQYKDNIEHDFELVLAEAALDGVEQYLEIEEKKIQAVRDVLSKHH